MEVHDINSGKLHLPDLLSGLMANIKRFLRIIHTGYGLAIFGLLFLIFLPLLLIPIIFPSRHKMTGQINRWWARLMFLFVGLPFTVEYRFVPDRKKQFIFCPNHFSYLDIPTVGLNHYDTIFVGKNAIEKVPLFGFMYRHLHITVDRNRMRSRYAAMIRLREAVDDGKNLLIYPEGGICSTDPPQMAPFKDGAFRLAIEKQIPIIPVTIPFNWLILPDQHFLLRWHPVKVIFHRPVETRGLDLDDIEQLKATVRNIIQDELLLHRKTNHEN